MSQPKPRPAENWPSEDSQLQYLWSTAFGYLAQNAPLADLLLCLQRKIVAFDLNSLPFWATAPRVRFGKCLSPLFKDIDSAEGRVAPLLQGHLVS